MILRVRRRAFHRRWGRWVGLWLAAVYACVSIGYLPTPALVGRWLGTGSTERHPCEDHLCGCANPLECWTACCCFTRQERVAWAIASGVEPPREVGVTDEEIAGVARSLDDAGGRRGVVSVAVLRHRMARGEATESSGAAKPRGRVMSALGCKFVPQVLALAAPVSVRVQSAGWAAMTLPLVGLVEEQSQRCATRALDVEAPPPRA